jgi:pyruvate dehydrogenase phosphatase
MATVGSCCLVGVICQQTLFVANLGDSRVVLGKKVGNTGGIAAIQLSTEHNANLEAIRHELEDLHPNDSQIAVLKRGVWKVKGIIQVISNPNLTFRLFQIKTHLRCFSILEVIF